MKVLSLSGGGTYIYGIAEAVKRIAEKGYSPDIVAGTSAGAIVALAYCVLGDEFYDAVMAFKPTEAMVKRPFTDGGRLTWSAIWRMVTFRNSLGVQSITPLLKKVITKQQFMSWQANEHSPEAYVTIVDINTGGRLLMNLKGMPYEVALLCVEASTRVPILTEPLEINGRHYIDGGIRDHNPSGLLLESVHGVTDIVSVYARPKDSKTTQLTKMSWYFILFRTLEIYAIEVSKAEEKAEIEWQKQRPDRTLVQVFLPRVLRNFYDTNPDRITELRRLSRAAVDES
jgi:NTE family protein